MRFRRWRGRWVWCTPPSCLKCTKSQSQLTESFKTCSVPKIWLGKRKNCCTWIEISLFHNNFIFILLVSLFTPPFDFWLCYLETVIYFLTKKRCVKSIQIRSFFYSLFSCIRTEYRQLRSKSAYSVRIQENTDQKKLRI